jgi:DNA-binding NarL/FixJ family response regulator
VNVIESSETLTEITLGLEAEDYAPSRGTYIKNMPITVLLADDAAVMRQAIRRVLESEPGIEIIGETADFAQTIKMATDLKPQVVVMDLHMPNASRVTPSDVKASFASSASQLLAISIWDDEGSQALAKTYGAVAFLDKVNLGTDLIPAIKRLLYRPGGCHTGSGE